MEKEEMSLVLPACNESLQQENPQWKIGVFNYSIREKAEWKWWFWVSETSHFNVSEKK